MVVLLSLSGCVLPVGDRFDNAIIVRRSDGKENVCHGPASSPGIFIWDDWSHTKIVQDCIEECKKAGFEEVTDPKDPALRRGADGRLLGVFDLEEASCGG